MPINNLKLFVSELFILGDLLKVPVKNKKTKTIGETIYFMSRDLEVRLGFS